MSVITNSSVRLAAILGHKVANKLPFTVKFPTSDKMYVPYYDISPHDLTEGLTVGHLTRVAGGEFFLLVGEMTRVAYASDEAMAVRWPKSCYVCPIPHKVDKYSTFTFCFSPTEIDCIFKPL